MDGTEAILKRVFCSNKKEQTRQVVLFNRHTCNYSSEKYNRNTNITVGFSERYSVCIRVLVCSNLIVDKRILRH